jgi:hypothetical protein
MVTKVKYYKACASWSRCHKICFVFPKAILSDVYRLARLHARLHLFQHPLSADADSDLLGFVASSGTV